MWETHGHTEAVRVRPWEEAEMGRDCKTERREEITSERMNESGDECLKIGKAREIQGKVKDPETKVRGKGGRGR